ncbi:ATP-binding protein [Streptomyces griseorubiginosus]|uniref:ATP-binding protein n=1 Tax=Streptomyces griseorubiginosus TaxID=67304 RepID=UPI001AD79EC3|nr:ATP-binding protein [Streptomyces griseorubiginosus]MBO4253111.1 GAF domain-containing protein [Streptomyces griseorubiginosus]
MAGRRRGGAKTLEAADEGERAAGKAVAWSCLVEHAPDGLAVIDEWGRFVQVNEVGAALCACPTEELIGGRAPFVLAHDSSVDRLGLFDDGPDEQVCTLVTESGDRREFAYRTRSVPGCPDRTVVAFRDVSAEYRRRRRIVAMARTAAKLASEGSITDILDALACEVLGADMLAAVQIMTLDESGESLQIMGTAGFPPRSDFFALIMECRDRGATLHMTEAIERGKPVVVPDRGRAVLADPAWEPLHDHLGTREWDWFASVPLMIRGRVTGVLNAFFAPGQIVGRRTLEFLEAMADQAAVAVDYAALLRNERELARREERRRLARDLHDSIVQQVFSIAMQAKSMAVLGAQADAVPGESVRRIADEVGTLSRTALTDLRAMVHELRPPLSTELGLEEAVRAFVESTSNRTGLRFDLAFGPGLEQMAAETSEDVYRIVAEAVHNVVKHAEADSVTLRMGVRGHTLTVTVTDDGSGMPPGHATHTADTGAGGGYGLSSMRQRAERWGGTVRIGRRRGGGTSVRVVVPLPLALPPTSDGGADGGKFGSADPAKGLTL